MTSFFATIAQRVSRKVRGLVRPPVCVTAWVFRHVADHVISGGSFRYLIYDRMGYGPRAYQPLYLAGGMEITNALHERNEIEEHNAKLRYALQDAISTYSDEKDVVLVTKDRREAWDAALHWPNPEISGQRAAKGNHE